MWRQVDGDTEARLLKRAIEFTGNNEVYGAAMLKVIFAWPKTMVNSLTNSSINKRAFVGHCAVCYELKIPEYITRMAWKILSEQQRIDANLQADNAIKKWNAHYEKENIGLHKNVGEQMLLQWPSR